MVQQLKWRTKDDIKKVRNGSMTFWPGQILSGALHSVLVVPFSEKN